MTEALLQEVKSGLKTIGDSVEAQKKATLERLDGMENKIKSLEDAVSKAAVPAQAKKEIKFKLAEIAMGANMAQRGSLESLDSTNERNATLKHVVKECAKGFQAYANTVTKDQNMFSDIGAGFVVPFSILGNEFIDRLKADAVATQMGARMIQVTGAGSVGIPRLDTSVTAQWLELGVALNIGSFQLGTLQAVPHRVGVACELENNSRLLSMPDLLGIAEDDMASEVALAVDKAVLKGVGASGEPRGIINEPSVLSQTVGTVSYNKILKFRTDLKKNNAWRGRLGWVMSAETEEEFLKLVDGASRPLFTIDPVVSAGGVGYQERFLALPYMTTTQLSDTSTGEVICGNWSEVIIPRWNQLVIATSPEANNGFLKGTFVAKVEMLMDVKIRHAASFAVSTDVTLS